ncbi:DUF1344 domain-containing protein (plasmid) [Ensifer adhaerens]|uniref:DUF1344 domain-containing protein n=1 Tax=Ensifer adhaerens TaxID=106592 RepID=UPI001CBC901D|nr:DUF1344 domain-containing protein [Ensifer adhaerens]MBZ7927262.1 DUF1344 domain-containing protein [Ensifer adhaerens]UAX98280.1 DUF1344 domain-containing protein [Ensifer adhaerens]UAY05662.1 DUF1344 domain-containing protein [Ensifer adhaerens]UAY13040.1 DUF1344 domain-containing protein [Ensifer adhaerens]
MTIERILPGLLVSTLLAASALAASLSTTGVVKTIDPAKDDIVLQSGETFTLPTKFDVKKLKVGETVKITYVKQGNKLLASKVEMTK